MKKENAFFRINMKEREFNLKTLYLNQKSASKFEAIYIYFLADYGDCADLFILYAFTNIQIF